MKIQLTMIAVAALTLGACATNSGTDQELAPPDAGAQSNGVDAATLAQYRSWIAEAHTRHPYADPQDQMYDVMMCESAGVASSVSLAGSNSGLFKYNRQTWQGDWNDYRAYNMDKPKVQIFATALAWKKNMQRHWQCYEPPDVEAKATPPDAPAMATPQNSALQKDTALQSAPQAQPPSVPPSTPPSTAPRAPRAAEDSPGLAQYRSWIAEARAKHPYSDSEQRMYDVMMCESRGNPSIVNRAGPYSGLFQYSTGTWNGAWNDYRHNNVLDAKAQVFATAQAWQKNMQRQWGCYTKAH